MRRLAAAGDEVDLLTVKEALRRAGTMDVAGGTVNLSSLTEAPADVANVEAYARIVKADADARALIVGFNSGMKDLFRREKKAAEVGAEIVELISDRRGLGLSYESYDARSIATEASRRFDKKLLNPSAITGIPTGSEHLDLYFYGYQRQTITLVAARPGVGKTTCGWNLLVKALRASDVRCGYFSLEMTRAFLEDRLLAMMSGVPLQWIITGAATTEQARAVGEACKEVAGWGTRLSANTNPLSLRQIQAEIRRVKRKNGLDLAFVDYIQLIGADGRGRSKREEIAETSKRLLDLAKQLDIAIVAFAQLNRQATEKDERPRLDQLAECDALYMDARFGLIMDRPRLRDLENEDKRSCELNLYVDKNTQGPTGKIEFHFDGPRLQIDEGGCRKGCQNWKELYALQKEK